MVISVFFRYNKSTVAKRNGRRNMKHLQKINTFDGKGIISKLQTFKNFFIKYKYILKIKEQINIIQENKIQF